jgi:hypothetical protein
MHGPLERGERPLFERDDSGPVIVEDEFQSESSPEFQLVSTPPSAAAARAYADARAQMRGPLERDRPLFNRNDSAAVAWPDEFPSEAEPVFEVQYAAPPAAVEEFVPEPRVDAPPPVAIRAMHPARWGLILTLGGAVLVASTIAVGRFIPHRANKEPEPTVEVQSLKTLAQPPPVDAPKPPPVAPIVDTTPSTRNPTTTAAAKPPSVPTQKQKPVPTPTFVAPPSQPPPLEPVVVASDPTPPAPDRPAPQPALELSKPVASGVPSGITRDPVVLTPPPSAPRAEDAIQKVLDTFRRAYSQLDAETVGAIWPSANTRTLSRAFEQLSEQRLEFDACSIETAGTTAQAYCTGRATFVPRVGNKTARVQPRQWTFSLKKVGNAWVLDAVDAR